jgi:hypothetical protein
MPIGILFVVLVLFTAWVDGVLGLLLLALLFGIVTYFTLVGVGRHSGVMNRPLSRIYARIESQIAAAVEAAPKAERDALRKVAAKKLEALDKVRSFDEDWNRRAAVLISVGVYAFPLLFMGLVGYLLRNQVDLVRIKKLFMTHIGSPVEAWCEARLKAVHK